MIRRLLYLLVLYFAIGLQLSLAAPIPGLGWDIDIVLIILVMIAARTGRGEAVIWAALTGLALDAFNPAAMGGQLVAKATAIFLLGVLIDAMNLEQPLLLGATIMLLTFLEHIIFRLFTPFLKQFGWAILYFDLPSAILTAIFGFFILWMAMRANIFTPRVSED